MAMLKKDEQKTKKKKKLSSSCSWGEEGGNFHFRKNIFYALKEERGEEVKGRGKEGKNIFLENFYLRR